MLGLLLGGTLEFSSAAFFVIAGVFLLGAAICHKQRFAGLLVLAFLFFAGTGAMRQAFTVDYSSIDLNSGAVVEGRIAKKTRKDGYVLYRVEDAKVGGEKLRGGIFLSSQSEYAIDDLVIAQANLRIPERADYPFGFDDFKYCRSQDVMLRGTALSDQKTAEAQGLGVFFRGANKWMGRQMEALFEKSALARSLLLGDSADLEPEMLESFEQAGIGHILSVSGIYLFLFVKLLERLLLSCRVSKKWRDGAGIAVFLVFLLVFGQNTAVWRMAIYYGLTKVAAIFWKRSDDLTLLAVCFLVTVLINPARVYDLGVQCSYAAVFSLICLMPHFERLFSWLHSDFLASTLAGVLCLNIGLFPLLLSQGNSIWAFSLLANLFVTVYAPLLLPALALSTLLFSVFGGAVSFLGPIGDALLSFLEGFALQGQAWQGARLTLPSFGGGMLLLWFALLFMLSRRNYLSWKPKAAMASVFAVFIVAAALLPSIPSGEIRVDFLNAEGTSAVVRAENGRSAVIGTGAGRNTADYVVKNGFSPSYTILLSKEEQSLIGIKRLDEFSRTGQVYADSEIARVLRERYGIFAEEKESYTVALSKRCSIVVRYESGSQAVGEVAVMVDGRNVCMLCLSEEGLARQMDADVLYWKNADRTALPRQIECRNVLLRIPQWGTALPVGEDGGKRVYNLYEAGRVTAYFGRETRLEAMYGSN